MASKIQVTLPNVDGQYTVQLFHENHSEKACVYIESIQVRFVHVSKY